MKKRKLIEKTKKTQRIIYLTEKGKKLNPKQIVELEQVSKISSEMLTSDAWKKVELKPFDVTKPGPLLKAGKVHPIINLINEILLSFVDNGVCQGVSEQEARRQVSLNAQYPCRYVIHP